MRSIALVALLLTASCIAPRRYEFTEKQHPQPQPQPQGKLLDTLDKALAASVQVYALNENGEGLSRGSGTVVSASPNSSFVLTARHMTDNPVSAWKVKQGRRVVNARVVAKGDKDNDWAILQTDAAIGLPVRLIDAGTSAYFAQECVAIGHAIGLDTPTFTVGHVQLVTARELRISAPIYYGNSGGGLFVVQGGELRLAGIVFAFYSAVTHLGLAVNVNVLRRLLR